MDTAGRVLIPKPLREAAGLKPGARLVVEYRSGRITIERAWPQLRLVRKGSVLVPRISGAPKISGEQVNQWIRRSRDR